jgi:uncharacterized membrane protein
MINCFLPTTPNPTSGYYLLIPESDLIELDLSVEEAFKLVMSAGLVAPERAVSLPLFPEIGPEAVSETEAQRLPSGP